VLLREVITERCQNAIFDAALGDSVALPDAVDLTTPKDVLKGSERFGLIRCGLQIWSTMTQIEQHLV